MNYIPQAEQNDPTVTYCSFDQRSSFSEQLNGKGIDIGPLHRPMVTHSGMQVSYLDRFDIKTLRDHYPEFHELPLVEPTIIDDAQYMNRIASDSQDFIIAAHVIEHMPDPLLAIKNWVRVLRPGGQLYLVVPDKRAIFDKSRVRTTLAHVVSDYGYGGDRFDPRHFDHYLDYATFVDEKHDPDEAIEHARYLIYRDYSIHYHVFLPCDVREMLEYFQQKITQVDILCGPFMERGGSECHFLIQKPEEA